jgi:O-antigen/teichoic acid export membrane protein
MNTRTKTPSFLNQILIYGLGLALNYGISIILLPLYSRLMPTEEYGVLEILNRTIEIASLLLLTQYGITYIRFFRDQTDEDYRRRVTSTSMYVIFIISGFIGIALILLRGALSEILFQSPDYAPYIVLGSVRYFAEMSFLVPFLYYQATEQPGKYIIISSSRFAATLGLNIVLLYSMDDKIAAVLWASIVSTMAYVLTVGVWVFTRSAMRFDWGIAKQIIKFTWSFTFLGLYGFIFTNGDRYFINEYCGKSQVGLYSAAYKIGMVLSTFIFSPILRAWNAKMVDVLRQPDGTRYLARLTTFAVLLYVSAGLVISIYSREIVSVVMDPRYFGCYVVIPVILLAYGFQGASSFVDSGIYYTKTTYLKIWHWTTAVVCIALYLLLIPSFCMMGAAWAAVGTFFVFAALTWYLSNRALPTEYEFGKLLRIGLTAVALYAINYQLESYEHAHFMYLRLAAQLAYPWTYLLILSVIKAPLLLVFAALMKFMHILEPEDKARLKEFYQSLRSRFSGKPSLEPAQGVGTDFV